MTPESSSDGRYLSAQEIAAELGQRLHLVRKALARVAGEIPWKNGTHGTGARIYHASALAAVAAEIGKLRRPKKKIEPDIGAYWEARAALRLLKRDANALADTAFGIFDLLKKNPPGDLVVVRSSTNR